MEKLHPSLRPKLQIVRNSNRICKWVICQKCFFAWEVDSAVVTMKEPLDLDDWMRVFLEQTAIYLTQW